MNVLMKYKMIYAEILLLRFSSNHSSMLQVFFNTQVLIF